MAVSTGEVGREYGSGHVGGAEDPGGVDFRDFTAARAEEWADRIGEAAAAAIDLGPVFQAADNEGLRRVAASGLTRRDVRKAGRVASGALRFALLHAGKAPVAALGDMLDAAEVSNDNHWLLADGVSRARHTTAALLTISDASVLLGIADPLYDGAYTGYLTGVCV